MRIGEEFLDFSEWTKQQLDHWIPASASLPSTADALDEAIPSLVLSAVWHVIQLLVGEHVSAVLPASLLGVKTVHFNYQGTSLSLQVGEALVSDDVLVIRLMPDLVPSSSASVQHHFDRRCRYKSFHITTNLRGMNYEVLFAEAVRRTVVAAMDWMEERNTQGARRRNVRAVNEVSSLVRRQLGPLAEHVLLWAVNEHTGVYVCDDLSFRKMQERISNGLSGGGASAPAKAAHLLFTELSLAATLLGQWVLASSQARGGDLVEAPYKGEKFPFLWGELSFFGVGTLVCYPLSVAKNQTRMVMTMTRDQYGSILPLLTNSFCEQVKKAIERLDVSAAAGGAGTAPVVPPLRTAQSALKAQIERLWRLAQFGAETIHEYHPAYRRVSALCRNGVSAALAQHAIFEVEKKLREGAGPGQCLEFLLTVLEKGLSHG